MGKWKARTTDINKEKLRRKLNKKVTNERKKNVNDMREMKLMVMGKKLTETR